VVGSFGDHGSKVLNTLRPVSRLDFHDTEQRTRVVMAGVELKDQRQLLASAPHVAAIAEQLRQLEANVVEGGTKPERASELVHRVLRPVEVEVRAGELAM
jgi:hypothetical protein